MAVLVRDPLAAATHGISRRSVLAKASVAILLLCKAFSAPVLRVQERDFKRDRTSFWGNAARIDLCSPCRCASSCAVEYRARLSGGGRCRGSWIGPGRHLVLAVKIRGSAGMDPIFMGGSGHPLRFSGMADTLLLRIGRQEICRMVRKWPSCRAGRLAWTATAGYTDATLHPRYFRTNPALPQRLHRPSSASTPRRRYGPTRSRHGSSGGTARARYGQGAYDASPFPI